MIRPLMTLLRLLKHLGCYNVVWELQSSRASLEVLEECSSEFQYYSCILFLRLKFNMKLYFYLTFRVNYIPFLLSFSTLFLGLDWSEFSLGEFSSLEPYSVVAVFRLTFYRVLLFRRETFLCDIQGKVLWFIVSVVLRTYLSLWLFPCSTE
jgi:hypothetical protein